MLARELLDGVKLVDVAGRGDLLGLELSHGLLCTEQAGKKYIGRIDEPQHSALAKLDFQVEVSATPRESGRLLHERRAVQFSPTHTQSPPSLNTTEQDKPTWLRDSVHGINRIIDGSVTALRRTDGTASEMGTPANDNWHPMEAA